mmetsp:Transcript_63560/g.77751  ORF Transcript_63560/g.77751 Transcript_63560/m.77751 type:complete len:252 (+) Transcript_63560:62-817(+)
MACLGLILLVSILILCINGCTVGEVDLSFITSEIICKYGENENSLFQIKYMPCTDNVVCEIIESLQMALLQEVEINSNNVERCWKLAKNSDVPNLSSQIIDGKNAYVIQYTNGDNNYVTDFRFFCGNTEFDTNNTSCGKNGESEVYLELYSLTICDTTPLIQPKSGLSGGWIFVICFGAVFVLYCIVGYTINGCRSKNWKDISGNIPNYSMWKTLPKATIAGCIFTFAFICGQCTKNDNSDNDFNDDFMDE